MHRRQTPTVVLTCKTVDAHRARDHDHPIRPGNNYAVESFSVHTGTDGATDRSSHRTIFILDATDRLFIHIRLPTDLVLALIASTTSDMGCGIAMATATPADTIITTACMTILDFFG
tara:strand:- start:1012 stop:1362 length:351 start_codon:yes stop_codon:yes gene_type:complete